jgi:hypothetical protein
LEKNEQFFSNSARYQKPQKMQQPGQQQQPPYFQNAQQQQQQQTMAALNSAVTVPQLSHSTIQNVCLAS